MKKMLALMLAFLLCVPIFAGCRPEAAEPPLFSFTKAEKALPIKQLVIIDGTGKLEDVGHVQEMRGRFCLTGTYMNGKAKQDGELYYYSLPEAFIVLRKRENVDWVLLFEGEAYGAGITDEGVEMIYTLDETLAAQTWTVFYDEALKAEK